MIKGTGMGLREWIIPQDRIFFDLFESLSSVVVRASEELVALVENYQDVKLVAQRIKGIEHEGDEIAHRIFEQLNTTFITPLDSQEISRLASALDDILDYIDGSTRRMHNYGLTETDAHMIELAKLIRLSATELAEAVKQIRTIKDPRRIEERCIEVNRLENIADDVLAHAITDLFKTDDAINIIKLKDIYDYLEIATDKCEDAANVLSDIAIRHS
jgi:uncharacterized protein Yka (UPF0111/DUF47 family)